MYCACEGKYVYHREKIDESKNSFVGKIQAVIYHSAPL